MMGESALRSEDWVGLGVAVLLHALLALALVAQMFFAPAPFTPTERVTVSLASEVSLEATAPDPVEESRAAIAPELSDTPEPEAFEPAPSPSADTPAPPPPSPSAARPQPRNPAPERERSRPDRRPEQPARQASNAGGTLIGDNFLEGQGNATDTDDTRLPASEIGRSARASIIQAIVRQIRPHWNAPSGVDAELLVTELAFELDEDGRLKGRPRVLRQGGINASNRPQSALHAERAIRAVQLAAPFDLPDEYYNAWKSIRGARFDRNLSR